MTIKEAIISAYKAHFDYLSVAIKCNFSWSSEEESKAREPWLKADLELNLTINKAIEDALTGNYGNTLESTYNIHGWD
jgi:hypothetical protein